mgnify:CR=1 FL=1
MNFHSQPTLRGKLVTLRPLQYEDFESLFLVASDPLVWQMHPEKNRYQREVFEKFFVEAMSSSEGALAVIANSTEKIIGSTRYYKVDPETRSVAIGYTFLGRTYWGDTYNREMKHLMLNYAFQFFDEVHFHIDEFNLISRKAIEKLGAELVDKLEKDPTNGQGKSTLIYQLTKEGFLLKLAR